MIASTTAVTTVMAYVANEGSISVIDAATGKVVKTINLPNSSFVNGYTQPGYIAISPNQQTAYATTLNEIVPINFMTNTTETPIPLGTTESSSNTAGHVVLSSDGSTAYVTDWDGSRVIVVNLQTGALSYINVLSDPLGMAIAPNGQTLYVANTGSNTVSVIDLATKAVTSNLQLSKGDTNPQDIAITADGSTAYVMDGDYSYSIGYGSTITPINLTNLTSGNHIPAGPWPFDIAVTPDGTTAYTTNTNNGLVTPVNLTNQQAGTAISANLYHPTGIAISPDGTLAYVTDNGFGGGTGAQVTPINLVTNTPESPINVGPFPLGVAFATITQQAPNLTASLAPTTPNASNNRYSTPVTLTIATDNSSVPAEYSLNGGSTWKTYSGPVTFSANGAYTVTYGWADVSGIVHAEGSTSFDIAQVAPDISTNSIAPGHISTTGTTEVTVTPNTSGDTLVYVIGSSPTLPPCVGDPLPNDVQAYASGATISGVGVGQYLDIYEVNGNHQIQAWHEFSLTSDIQAAIGAPTMDPSSTTVSSRQTVTVTGVVYDVYHNPTAGAQVDLTSSLGSWQTASATTDASGVYMDQWTAPTVTTQTPVTVTAAVYGTNMNNQATMTVSPTPVPTGLSHNSVTPTGWLETWNTVPGAALYNVYLNGAQVGSTTHAAYDFTGEQAGGTYSVSVTDAVYGVTSAASNPDSVTTSPLAHPTGSSQGQGGSSSSGSGSGSSGSSTAGNGPTSSLSTAVMQQSVDTKGGTWSTSHDGTSFTLQVPVGAFPSPETMYMTTGSVANLGNKVWIAKKQRNLVVWHQLLRFCACTTNYGHDCESNHTCWCYGFVVYKLQSDGSLTPLTATASQGKVEISFSTDPDFVILAKQPNMRVITFANKVSIVPSVVMNDAGTPTTYMPIWYVMQMLRSYGVQSTWDGYNWDMSKGGQVSLGSVQPGVGTMHIYLNGTRVQNVTGLYATDPTTSRKTTYMPIWYVMQVLNKLNMANSWDGTTWSLG